MDPDNAKTSLSQSGSGLLLPCAQNAPSELPIVDTVPHRDKLNPTRGGASDPASVASESTASVAPRNPERKLFSTPPLTAPPHALTDEQLRRVQIREPDLQHSPTPTAKHPTGPRPQPLGSHPVHPERFRFPLLDAPDIKPQVDLGSPDSLGELSLHPRPLRFYDPHLFSCNPALPADQGGFRIIDHDWSSPRPSSARLPKEGGIRSARAVRLRRPKAVQVTTTGRTAPLKPSLLQFCSPSAPNLQAAASESTPPAPPLPPLHIQPLRPPSPPPSPYNHNNSARSRQGRPRSSNITAYDGDPPAIEIMNSMNGAGMGVGMVGPTPAGHQQELSHIYGMVDDLSSQLAENRRVLEEVVSLVGRIRARARHQNLSNEDIIAGADDSGTTENLDRLISILSETLEKALHERDSNSELLQQYANVMANMVRQAHDHKARTVTDVSAWHRSYRQQLAEAREENSRLREQIWDVQERAGRLNESVRQFRTSYDADPSRYEARVENIALRQEVRFWKRMAMADVPDDDPMWSDDDDLIDPAETRRLAEVERAAAAMAASQHLAAQEEEENQLKEDERCALEAARGSSGANINGADDPAGAASMDRPVSQGGVSGPGGARGVLMQREGETP